MCDCPETVNAGAPFGEVPLGGSGWMLSDLASLAFVVWIGLQLMDRFGGKRAH